MNDKHAACILLQKGLTTLSENLRSKILTLEYVELHEEMIELISTVLCTMSFRITQKQSSVIMHKGLCTTHKLNKLGRCQISVSFPLSYQCWRT